MSSQSSYVRNGSQQRSVRRDPPYSAYESRLGSDIRLSQFYHAQASMSSPDSAQYLGATRGMGPPTSFPSDFPTPPQPIEIEVNNSRTLPNPSASSSTTWDGYSNPGFGPFSDYGPPSIGRPLPVDNQARGIAPDPLQQWYTGNDGPWIPKGISAPLPEERLNPRARPDNRIPMPNGNHYRQPNPSDAGSLQYTVAPSDSGYGTRHSDGNASVFSADINDRDQDCQSLVGHVADYQPFHGLNNEVVQHRDARPNDADYQPFHGLNSEVVQHRDARPNDAWIPLPSSAPSNTTNLVCPTCHKGLKTRSELKKHDLRHRKPFVCKYPRCTRIDGFSTSNDLDRHTKSKHPLASANSEPTKRYRCHVQGCKSKEKSWPRLDNFRSHLKRVHSQALQAEEEFDDMIRRAEFVERSGLTTGQEDSSSQRPSFPNPSRAVGPVAQEFLPKASNIEPNWEPIYREVTEQTPELLAPKDSLLEEHSEPSTPDSNAPALNVRPQETVQPQDVFRPPAEIRNNPSSLGNILLAPVGASQPAIASADRATPQPAVRPSKISPQGKATRLNDASVSEAKITEAIVTALVGAEVKDEVKDRSLHQDLERSKVPHEKGSSGASWPVGLNSSMSSTGKPNGHVNPISSPAVQDHSKSLHEKKAREVLKTLHDLGYIVQKDPSHSPKAQNPGSAASNKSENIVTCQTCKRFKGRPCELKKHMKRHSRPYGCTFLTCNKTFGSKNDWKRHENSQHFHLETWRCNAEKLDGVACAKVCYRRQSFQDHLKKDHDISDTEDVKSKVEKCRIGRNCQARFWCGFCNKLVDLTKKGVDAWTERFDHIDDHFMGRNGLSKQSIQDWIPVDSDKPKGDVESSSDLSPGKDNQDSPSDRSNAGSPNGDTPEASGAVGGSPSHTKSGDENTLNGLKRSRSSRDDDNGPAKRQRPAARKETLVYCCQCEAAHNPKLDQACTVCEDSHTFCTSCTTKARPAGQDTPLEQ